MSGLRKVSGVSFLEISDWLISEMVPYRRIHIIEGSTPLRLDRIVRLSSIWQPKLIKRFGDPSGITEYKNGHTVTVYGYRYKADFVPDYALPLHELERMYDMKNGKVFDTTYIQYV